jgi:hypothetical protein
MKVKDFPIDTNSSNISEIVLTKRYPEQGFALNTKSEMVVYVLNGKVHYNQEAILETGSIILVKINEKYYWQPIGKVTLLIFSTPPWTPEQQTLLN